ncbi:MAG: phosphoglucosamine mutase [Dehalococcoidales bacterium]|nr:phosphoglucosamine mutase [Dehalococcoidales bacterium]
MKMSLFGSSGIRRLADRSLVELSLKTGLAVGKVYPSVVVGCDTRTSGDAVKHAFIAGLLVAGSRCADAGVMPTPTLALATRKFQAGAMVTASHNPPEYNGIKLLNADGSAFDAKQREQIETMIQDDSLAAVPWGQIESSRIANGAIEEHIDHIVSDFPGGLKTRVVLDCGCGAASVITPYLLRRLGCEVVALNCYPSGFFPHPIEPTEDNLKDLLRATREFGADVGIAHDGDADRMMAVDERGRFIPGDKLLALFARQMAAKKVVTTLDASMVIDEMGFTVTRTKVGDIYVSEELKKGGDFGGEPSGAWVFPRNSLCPDGIYAAAKVAAIAGQQKLSQLVDSLPDYPLLRGSLTMAEVALDNLSNRLLALEPLSVSDIDGIRLNFGDGWLLIRPSGTEPRVRVTAEARSDARVRELYDSAVSALKDCVRGGN